MVAKITIPLSAEKTLRYNERKVERGKAVCLGGENCLREPQRMTMQQKLAVLEHRNALNDRAKTKTLHVSLNFGVKENLSADKLMAIASFYMNKIGFENQPYFVYQHHDAGHPHIHIVSTTIRQDGSRINTYNIGRNQSESARTETELHFGLIQNKRKTQPSEKHFASVGATKAVYGKEETAKSIIAVLNTVLYQYNYTSFSELNAVLAEYNIVADRGTSKSEVHKKGGLYYRILDNKGNKIGVPIKASSLPGKPTLSFLKQRFQSNYSNRKSFKQKLDNSLHEVILQMPKTMMDFNLLLKEKKIAISLKCDKNGSAQEITFIDSRNQCVFCESDIDSEFSLTSLQTKLKGDASEMGLLTNETFGNDFLDRGKHIHPQPGKLRNKQVKITSLQQQSIRTDSSSAQISTSLTSKNKSSKQK